MPTRKRSDFPNLFGRTTRRPLGPPSPVEAQRLVDDALVHLGLDPRATTDSDGWRHMAVGEAKGAVNVIELEEGIHAFVVWSILMDLPSDRRLQTHLFETLLELNFQATGMARFSIKDSQVILSVLRPIRGLARDEIVDALRAVLEGAANAGPGLCQIYDIDIPDLQLDYATWEGILTVMRACEPRVQSVYRQLLEGWVARGGSVESGGKNIGLESKSKGKTLAGLIPNASAGPIVTVGWASLEKTLHLQAKDAKAVRDAIPRPDHFTTTASSAHLPVEDSFTTEVTEKLLDALVLLESALERASPPRPAALPDLKQLWGLDLKVGKATIRNTHTTLDSCPESTQLAYAHLIQGWHDAGEKVYTNKPDRVHLRLTAGSSTFAICTLLGPQRRRGARIELFYPLTYYFAEHTPARIYYEQAIAQLDGFEPHNSGARISTDKGIEMTTAKKLMKALLKLAASLRESQEEENAASGLT